mgnify:CR=1 FL=1
MIKRRNPFPGVTRTVDRHGKVRWRYRRKGFSCYLPGEYASVEFRSAYEQAVAGAKAPVSSAPKAGTLHWLVEQYLRSSKYRDRSEISRKVLRKELDWLLDNAAQLPFTRLEIKHIEALMDRKAGPSAANKVRKNLSLLLNFAIRRGYGITFNPARYAEPRKENPDGFHVWSEAEIAKFKARHPSGSKARLALALFLSTGASRQDVAEMGWGNIDGDRISYQRGKTGVVANLPILPELAEELRNLPEGQPLFLAHSEGQPYKPETLGNWFRVQCNAAGVPGSAHGLRKAGATRLANAGGTPDEIRAFLAHKTNKEGQTYTKKADRARLADSGLAKLGSLNHSEICPTPENRLGKKEERANENSQKAGFVAARRGIEPLFPG